MLHEQIVRKLLMKKMFSYNVLIYEKLFFLQHIDISENNPETISNV